MRLLGGVSRWEDAELAVAGRAEAIAAGQLLARRGREPGERREGAERSVVAWVVSIIRLPTQARHRGGRGVHVLALACHRDRVAGAIETAGPERCTGESSVHQPNGTPAGARGAGRDAHAHLQDVAPQRADVRRAISPLPPPLRHTRDGARWREVARGGARWRERVRDVHDEDGWIAPSRG